MAMPTGSYSPLFTDFGGPKSFVDSSARLPFELVPLARGNKQCRSEPTRAEVGIQSKHSAHARSKFARPQIWSVLRLCTLWEADVKRRLPSRFPAKAIWGCWG